MPGFREFLRSRNGQYVGLGLLVVGLAFAGYTIYSNVGSSDAMDISNSRVFIDSVTGKTFRYTIGPGVTVPVPAPSGGNNGYQPELCYWTKDGTIKTEPTYVLLNTYKKQPEPTFCQDCDRLVRLHNPSPIAGSHAPPTKAEYEARKSN